jgi:predicted GIY-YIG superfamily endonuclease
MYALRNLVNAEIYVGFSSDPDRRLTEHNAGKNRYTKTYMPWEKFFTEPHPDYPSARRREKYFKPTSGKRFLRALL